MEDSKAAAKGAALTMEQLQKQLEETVAQMVAISDWTTVVRALGSILSQPPPPPSSLKVHLTATPATPLSHAAVSTLGGSAADKMMGAVIQELDDEDMHGPPPIVSAEPSPRNSLDVPSEAPIGRFLKSRISGLSGSMAGSMMWQKAIRATQKAIDPWASRNLHTLSMEHCVRHRYHAARRVWVTDDVLVKIEGRPFAAGAMRECYAMKKLSTFTASVYHDWKKAQNCVAKRYKKEAKPGAYHMDVLVQMDAKLMGEEYNKTEPPKQVDMLQAAIVEFPDRMGSPLYCIEQLIEGDYVKYNSNSGFVQGDDLLRHTPQAFSHFTWVWSKGQRICVDIQGVGDLYTDPQIHTFDGEGYGEGNLGSRGVALFLRTHECNPLCERLKLPSFYRCKADVKAQGYSSQQNTSAQKMSGLGRGGPGAGGGGGLSRPSLTLMRHNSVNKRLSAARKGARQAAEPHSQAELRELLKEVPHVEAPEAVVHLEVARIYSEVVLLPDIRPQEDPEDCLKGGLYHLYQSAREGCCHALVMVARMHADLSLSSVTFENLVKTGKQLGELVLFPETCLRATLLAAERGIGGAAAALAHGYHTCQGVADGLIEESQPAAAIKWYRKALELLDEVATLKSEEEEYESSMAVEEEEQQQDSEVEEGLDTPVGSPRTQGELHPSVTRTDAGSEVMGVVTAKLPPLGQGPSKRYLRKLRMAAEEEASGLPFGCLPKYELQATLGKLLLEGCQEHEPDAEAAAELFNAAAEEASSLGKGKLAQKYYELAAAAESM